MSKNHENNEDEEIVFEPGAISSDKDDEEEFEIEDDGATDKDKIKKLRDQLKDSQKKSAENMDGWQRALADYANLQKNTNDHIKDLREYIVGGFVSELLPVVESFEMAFSNKESWEKVDKNWRTGVEYIYNQLQSAIKNYGVDEINETNINFNPEIHQAVNLVDTKEEEKDNKISNVIQKGYRHGNQIIRPAKVEIYKFSK